MIFWFFFYDCGSRREGGSCRSVDFFGGAEGLWVLDHVFPSGG